MIRERYKAKNPHAEAASKSLNKTIGEIEAFVLGDEVPPPQGVLRPFLHSKLADLAEKWFRVGFRRGCIEARREWRLNNGGFRKEITYDGTRELFAGQQRKIQ